VRALWLLVACSATSPERQKLELQSWRFHLGDVDGAERADFDDSGWSEVTLPHTWNALDGQSGPYFRGVGWYRGRPAISPSGRRVFLEIDAANLTARAFVNGAPAGEHRGGYARFRFDITALVREGENRLAIAVDNRQSPDVAPLDADYTFFGGLYRGVRLWLVSPLHLALDSGADGVFIQAQGGDLQVAVEIQNDDGRAHDAAVTAHLLDGGREVATLHGAQRLAAGSGATVQLSGSLPSPHRWNGRADPHLYTAVVEVTDGALSDSLTTRFGLRDFSVDADQGFRLNGTPLELHGASAHQDRLNAGWAIGEAEIDEDLAIADELGANALRAAHYQHAQRFYDRADDLGLVVWAEIPLIDHVTDSAAFSDNAAQQLRELIRQNFNHPSICFWGISNELTLVPGPDPRPLQDALGALVRAEDPSRLSTLAGNGPASDLGHTDVIGYNQYFGWYVGTTDDFAPWADAQHAALPTTPIAVSEYGAGANIHFHSDTPVPGDHSEEYQALFHEAHFAAMKTRPFLWGRFVWNLFDFASSGRNEGDTPGRNDKGLVTYDRQTRKDAFYFYRANWNPAPFVHIAAARFTDRTQAQTSIKVYGNLDTVAVKLNGASLGTRAAEDGTYRWTGVTLRSGSNLVEATGTKDGVSYRDQAVWNLGP
jgi:beta-galactosidase